MEISTPELAIKYYSNPVGMSVKAAEIHHVPQLQCFGYTLQEPWTRPRSLNIEAARALGVTSVISYRMLKSGFPAFNDDRTRQVEADEVCGEVPRPRKVTVLGDCCLVPPAMEMLAMNSDVLVHEATLAVTDKGNKVAVGGHSSAAQAAVFANKVKAKVLIMNHLPKKVSTYKGVKECLDEAESRIRGGTKVQLGYDHLEILIPRKGFEFGESKPSRSLWLHEREVTAVGAKIDQSGKSERLAATEGGEFFFRIAQ
jgi:ribonuclease BN (tRNA processing enzyme)